MGPTTPRTAASAGGDRAAGASAAPGPGRRWWRWVVLGLVLALVVAGAVAVAVRSGDDGSAGRAPTEAAPSEVAPSEADPAPREDDPAARGEGEGGRLTRADLDSTAVGVFRGTSPGKVAEYEEWLGSPVDLAVDFSARETWRDIAAPGYLVDAWEGEGRRLVLGVPMLPDGVDDVSIDAGADGDYDEYFRDLAELLVEHGQEDAVLRIGWEFNLDSWAWSTGDEDAYVAYWRRIAEAMGSVEGAEFRYDWTVNNGDGNRYDATEYYPGDDVVDYVGVDAYDVSGKPGTYPLPEGCTGGCAQERRERAWEEQVYGGGRGLEFWSGFARERDKQLSLPEWGAWDRNDGTGGGDNPHYIEQMADFIEDPDNAVGYHAYFEDDNAQGRHRLQEGDLDDAAERYLELFGG